MSRWGPPPRFDDHWEPVTETGCHLWTGPMGPQGYGRFFLNGKRVLAHRAAYILSARALPDWMHVLHKCDTPLCVNPAHLFLGTQQDNMRDMNAKGRRNGPRGESHPFYGDKGAHLHKLKRNAK